MPEYRGAMTRAVGASLNEAKIAKTDLAAAALCRRYAALIDDAQPAARLADHIAAVNAALETLAVLDPLVGVDYMKAWGKITEALAAHSVASDLGPKLLAGLSALGLTVAGRGVKGGTSGVGTPAVAPAGPANELQQRRESRAERAGPNGA
jgi:hypothetical protein